MDTTPLPNQDSDVSDSDQESQYSVEPGPLIHYVARITSHDKFKENDLISFIKEEPEIFAYVISRETVPQEHYHLVLSVDEGIEEQAVRDIIKAFLVPLWQDPATYKLPRGFGNKQYSLELCKDLDKAISYAVKQGQFWFEGYTEEHINARKAESFEKKKISNFKSEYIDLCEQFKESSMGIDDFMVKYVQLKSKYGQQVNLHHAYGYAISNLIARDPSEAADFVYKFLYNQ